MCKLIKSLLCCSCSNCIKVMCCGCCFVSKNIGVDGLLWLFDQATSCSHINTPVWIGINPCAVVVLCYCFVAVCHKDLLSFSCCDTHISSVVHTDSRTMTTQEKPKVFVTTTIAFDDVMQLLRQECEVCEAMTLCNNEMRDQQKQHNNTHHSPSPSALSSPSSFIIPASSPFIINHHHLIISSSSSSPSSQPPIINYPSQQKLIEKTSIKCAQSMTMTHRATRPYARAAH